MVFRIAKVQEETGILLTKPIELIPRLEDIKEDIKEIDEEDIREAMNIPKERAKLRKALAQMEARTTAAAVGDRPPSALDGMAMPPEETQGPLWKVTGEGETPFFIANSGKITRKKLSKHQPFTL